MIHEAGTVHGTGNTFAIINTINLVPAVCHLALSGPIEVIRLSTIIQGSAPGTCQYGMAIYRLAQPKFNRDNIVDVKKRPELELVVAGASKSHATTDKVRYNATFAKGYLLDPEKAIYFVAWAVTDVTLGGWHTPITITTISPAWPSAVECTNKLENIRTWPSSLRMGSTGQRAPAIVARSALGVYAFGSTLND